MLKKPLEGEVNGGEASFQAGIRELGGDQQLKDCLSSDQQKPAHAGQICVLISCHPKLKGNLLCLVIPSLGIALSKQKLGAGVENGKDLMILQPEKKTNKYDSIRNNEGKKNIEQNL